MATPDPEASLNGSATGGRIAVIDGLYSDAFVREMQDILLRQGWTYSEGAYPGAELVHWVTELSADEAWVMTFDRPPSSGLVGMLVHCFLPGHCRL